MIGASSCDVRMAPRLPIVKTVERFFSDALLVKKRAARSQGKIRNMRHLRYILNKLFNVCKDISLGGVLDSDHIVFVGNFVELKGKRVEQKISSKKVFVTWISLYLQLHESR